MRTTPYYIIIFIVLLTLTACGGGGINASVDGGDTLRMSYAQNITIVEDGDEVHAVLANPWDTTAVLADYTWNKAKPYKRLLVSTAVHCGLLKELGAEDCIVGVFDKRWIHCLTHEVADCGNSVEPNIEAVIKLNPDAVLISSFENNPAFDKLSKLGIPVIQCSDYMEPTALGRAEWMRFYARLVGQGDRADSLFRTVEERYARLRDFAAQNVKQRVKVLSETCYGNVWYQSGPNSTIGRIYTDAGAVNPFQDIKESGSVPLSAEEVLLKAKDADVWVMKYSGDHQKTLDQLAGEGDVYSHFDAYHAGNVWGCNTSSSGYYEQVPFHPDRLLEDFIFIFHPELHGSPKSPVNIETPHFYTRLSR